MKDSQVGMYAQLAKVMAKKAQKDFRGIAIVRGLKGIGLDKPKTEEELGREFGITASKVKVINDRVCGELMELMREGGA